MFGRRKKSDGFEWHQYIRTAVRQRREQRRQRVVDARRTAAQQVGAAGAALAAGSRAAGVAAKEGARAGLGAAGLAAQSAATIGAVVAGAAWRRSIDASGRLLRPVIAALAKPNIGGPILLASAIALGAGIGRYRGTGLDQETTVTFVIGAALLLAALPAVLEMTGLRMPRLAIPPRAGLAAAVVALVAGGAWLMSGSGFTFGRITGLLASAVGGSKPLEGRAEAISGDLMRVGNTTVRLAGIEAPEDQQMCGTGNRRFRCAAEARAALARLVNGRSVRCSLSGTDAGGRALARCMRGKTDINEELVREGHVFAASGLFAAYASQERQAREAKAGVWGGGDSQRPADFRAKVWDEAKRRAPDGCPIKGVLSGGSKVYLLPWSPEYERGRVQKARGERWFCSEREAVGAGFKPSLRG